MGLLRDNFLYESVPETVTKPVMAFRANLEFLSSCAHVCPGCFVNKDNGYSVEDLEVLYDIMGKVNASGLLFDELVLGPVDSLGAANTEAILMEPLFQKIMSEFKPILALPTTFMCEDERLERIIAIFNEHYVPEMELEWQIVIHPEKIFARDILYIENLKRKIALLDTLKQPCCYAMQMNVRSLSGISLEDVSRFVADEFETIIDVVPSFFRTGNARVVSKMIRLWNKELTRQVTDENKHVIHNVIVDQSHGWFNYANWAFKNGHLYASPFIHENVIDLREQFRIPKAGRFYEVDQLLSVLEGKWAGGFSYAKETNECSSCQYLNVCVSRQVLDYMQANSMKQCLLPKQVLDLYGSLGDAADSVYTWQGYSIQEEIASGNWKNHRVHRDNY